MSIYIFTLHHSTIKRKIYISQKKNLTCIGRKSMKLILLLLPFLTMAQEHPFIGFHYFAEFYGCDKSVIQDSGVVKEMLISATSAAGCNIIGIYEKTFPNGGYTLVLPLEESHTSIHTYPEYGSCFIDFFTCGSGSDLGKFIEILDFYLMPQRKEHKFIQRGNVDINFYGETK